MAKRSHAYRRTCRRTGRRAGQRTLAAAFLLCAAAALLITVFGGRAGIPTWAELYRAAGVSNAGPAVNESGAAPAEPTQVHVIDVGQGDAVLLVQDGQYALIDAGTEDCETALLSYLDQLGVKELQLLVMTHPHADHIGSMDAVLRHVKVDRLWMPDLEKAATYPASGALERVISAAEDTDVTVAVPAAGDTCALGSGTITVLGTGLAGDNLNNLSLATMFTAGEFRFLDTGDGEKEVEQALLDSGADLSAAVFKAAHHGSRTSNTLAFLQAVRPRAVLISCGLNNDYGHPHPEALEHFAAVGARAYRTDQQGTLVAGWSAGTGLTIYTTRQGEAAA
jgi:beta-lactamase superfamily II metal-dependent hydrolase